MPGRGESSSPFLLSGGNHGILGSSGFAGGGMDRIWRLNVPSVFHSCLERFYCNEVSKGFRLVVYFLFGLFLGGYSVWSMAETISATYVTGEVFARCQRGNGGAWSAWQDVGCVSASCSAAQYKAAYSSACSAAGGYFDGNSFCYAQPQFYTGQQGGCATQSQNIYTCPTGQNWTLSGSSCIRPDCRSDQTRDGSGVCTCPTGKTEAGGQCITICPAGTHPHMPDNGQCFLDCIGDQRMSSDGSCVCSADNGSVQKFTTNTPAGSSWGGNGCNNGCSVQAGFSACFGLSPPYTCYGNVRKTGTACGSNTSSGLPPIPVTFQPPNLPPADTSGTNKDGTAPDPLNSPDNAKDPVKCAQAGGSWGTFNNVGKCLMPDATTPVTKVTTSSTTKTNPDNSTTTTTTTTTATNSGPSTETQVSSSTTTTTKDSNGNVTGTVVVGSVGGKGSFCSENPNSPICKNGTFGGSCDTGFTCDGDPVQCATAKASWEHRCQMKWSETDNALSQLVTDAATTKTADEDKALNKDGSNDIDLWQKFQENKKDYLTFTKSCPASAEFSYNGHTYTFDLAPVCQLGLLVSILLRIAAYMVLLRMFSRMTAS